MALKFLSLAVSAASAAWMLQGCGGDEKNVAKAKKGGNNPNPPLSGDAKKPPADEKPPPKSVVEQAPPSRKSGRVGDSTPTVVVAKTQRGPVRDDALEKGHALRQGDLQQHANAVDQERAQPAPTNNFHSYDQQRAVAKQHSHSEEGVAGERTAPDARAKLTKFLQEYAGVQHDVTVLEQRRAQAKRACQSGLLNRDQRKKLSRARAAWKKQLKQKSGSLKQLQQQWTQEYGPLKQLHAALQELTASRNRMLKRTRDEPELH